LLDLSEGLHSTFHFEEELMLHLQTFNELDDLFLLDEILWRKIRAKCRFTGKVRDSFFKVKDELQSHVDFAGLFMVILELGHT
jgi:hypothetical protein